MRRVGEEMVVVVVVWSRDARVNAIFTRWRCSSPLLLSVWPATDERGRKGGKSAAVERGREREGGREAGARAKEDRERKREGKRRRWSAYTETHVRTRGAAALSSVPSAPSDVGQCSRLRRSRELVPIKARVPGLRSRPRRGWSSFTVRMQRIRTAGPRWLAAS